MTRVRLGHVESLATVTGYRDQCAHCGTVGEWAYRSNGDGAVAQQCTQCGQVYPAGRWYQDGSVGVRLPSLSLWSSLVIS